MKKFKPNLLFFPATDVVHSPFIPFSPLLRRLHALSLALSRLSSIPFCARSFASVEFRVFRRLFGATARSVLVNPKNKKKQLHREMRVNFVAIKTKGRRTASSLLFAQKETILLTQLTNTNDIQIYTRTHSYRLNHTKIKRLCECLRSLISSSYTNKSNEKQITKQTQI